MEPTGFFVVRGGEPGAGGGELDEAGVAVGGYSAHLGWMQGQLYLTDLGGAGQILVNGTPVESNRPVAIQAGDRITIGDTHLTWNAGPEAARPIQEPEGAQVPDVPVVLPGEAVEARGPRITAEPEPSAAERDEPAPADALDRTLFLPKEAADRIRAEEPDPAPFVPERAAEPPAP